MLPLPAPNQSAAVNRMPPNMLNSRNIGVVAISVIDQGMVAIANFLISVLLARLLSPEDYGRFLAIYAFPLLIVMLHAAVITEPVMIFGRREFEASWKSYIALLVRLHWRALIVCTITGAALLIFSTVYSEIRIFAAMILMLVPLTMTWLQRRLYFACLQPLKAAIASTIYGLLVIGLVIFLNKFNLLSSLTAFLAMAAGSVLTIFAIGFPHNAIESADIVKPKLVIKLHWQYSKSVLPIFIFYWLNGSAIYLIAPLLGLEGITGNLRIALNIVSPMLQIYSAVGALRLPLWAGKGTTTPKRTLFIFLTTALIGGLIYGFLSLIFRNEIVNLLYRGTKIVHAFTLMCLLIFAISEGCGMILHSVLKVNSEMRFLLRVVIGQLLMIIAITVPVAMKKGVDGAAMSMAGISVMTTLILLLRAVRIRHLVQTV